jgi:heat shock protein HslJ
MKKSIGLLLFAGWALSSCSSATSSDELSGLQGGWQLLAFELDSGPTVPVPNPQDYTATFTSDGRLNAQADCNVCNGSYETAGNALTIGPLGCTRAFCQPPSFFNEYTAALSSSQAFLREGDELFIRYAGGTMRFGIR